MSISTQKSSSYPQFRTGLLITGAALVGAGTMLALAGFAVSGSHLLSATGAAVWQNGDSAPQVADA